MTNKSPDTKKTAAISSCGKYRYMLGRDWEMPGHYGTGRFLLVIMLNPSTADAQVDDPTIRRCVNLAKRLGFASLRVANLFALRSPSPRVLRASSAPIGPRNDHWLRRLTANPFCGRVICAWGKDGRHLGRADAVMEWLPVAEPFALGINNDGSPKHPLYLSDDLIPLPYRHRLPRGSIRGTVPAAEDFVKLLEPQRPSPLFMKFMETILEGAQAYYGHHNLPPGVFEELSKLPRRKR